MLDLNELEQLVTFADMGTLSMAAEKLHISQPTITRTMQHLEETFEVPLFIRRKNRIALNAAGKKAAELAGRLLAAAEETLKGVQDFDKSLRTIAVSSCAPAPLWYVLPALASACPGRTAASSIKNISAVIKELETGSCQLGILPDNLPEIRSAEYVSIPFLKENLFVCVPPSHALAAKSFVSFSDINGFNFLLKSEIGFWDEMCRKQMPSSRFLVQADEFEFRELIRESALPCFTTNLAGAYHSLLADRIQIPITNPEANVTYHLLCRRDTDFLQDLCRALNANMQEDACYINESLLYYP